MSSATLYRASGLAMLLGVLLGIIGSILNIALFPGNDPHQYLTLTWVVVTLLNFLGSMLLLMGLPGIAARQAPRAGQLGFVGFVLSFLGGFLTTSFSVVFLLVLPWLAQVAPKLAAAEDGPPAVFVFLLIAGILLALGGILLGIATMRAGILPRWAGLLLLIGAVLNLVSIPLNGILGNIVGTVAFVLIAGGLGWMGYVLMMERRGEAVQSASTPARIAS